MCHKHTTAVAAAAAVKRMSAIAVVVSRVQKTQTSITIYELYEPGNFITSLFIDSIKSIEIEIKRTYLGP